MNFVNFCSTLRANIPAISPNYPMKLHKKLHELIFLAGIIILVCLDHKITVKTSILADMPRTRDLSYEERVAIISLKESGYSFRKIAEQLDCSKFTATNRPFSRLFLLKAIFAGSLRWCCHRPMLTGLSVWLTRRTFTVFSLVSDKMFCKIFSETKKFPWLFCTGFSVQFMV